MRSSRLSTRIRLIAALAACAGLAGLVAGVAPAASTSKPSFVAPSLLATAQASPNAKVRVIVQAVSVAAAEAAVAATGGLLDGDHIGRRLGIVYAVAAQMKAKRVAKLADGEGLIVTPDSKLQAMDLSSDQLWPYESGNASLWTSVDTTSPASLPTIAIVDSGIDEAAPDVAGRVLTSVVVTTATPNSAGDGRGHGTFVAGIAAGSAVGYAGAAPGAKLVSVDVLNDDGMGYTSDVVAGADWILAHKDEYGIRVANFSLTGTTDASIMFDPLDKAVERLWFAGVAVVTAVGNYGQDGAEGTVAYAPSNDPFVISVGAADLAGTNDPSDDFAAPWSIYGYTYDGFRKPELGASGRYMVGPVPPSSTLVSERPDRVVAPGYMQLSGTSFAAPVAAGAAAHILALHPEYSPDQVKGALMVTARPTAAAPWSLGLGELDAVTAATVDNPPNPNTALDQFLTTDSSGATVFDSATWSATAQTDANWASANWASANWSSANWSGANWAEANWASANWSDANWAAANWSAANWSDANWAAANWSDTSLNDEILPGGYPLTATEAGAVGADPLLQPLAAP